MGAGAGDDRCHPRKVRMAYASPSKQEGDVLRVAVLQPEDAGGDAGARSASICLAWYRRCRRLASPGG